MQAKSFRQGCYSHGEGFLAEMETMTEELSTWCWDNGEELFTVTEKLLEAEWKMSVFFCCLLPTQSLLAREPGKCSFLLDRTELNKDWKQS